MTLPVTSVTQGTPPALVDQSLALGVYLESLLCESPQAVMHSAGHSVRAPVSTVADPSPVITAAPAPPLEAGTPAADTPFQVLLFRVAGLTLAVPLAELNGVLPWPECITPLPGHTPFFLGVTTHLGRHVKIIDTGYLMAPEQHRPLQRRLPRRAETGLRHVVLMGGGEWGMACETIAEVLTLAPGEVRWRATRAERPWVAGTVTEHLCALLDTRAFAAELKGGGVSSGRNSS